jgi:hypothetical protein
MIEIFIGGIERMVDPKRSAGLTNTAVHNYFAIKITGISIRPADSIYPGSPTKPSRRGGTAIGIDAVSATVEAAAIASGCHNPGPSGLAAITSESVDTLPPDVKRTDARSARRINTGSARATFGGAIGGSAVAGDSLAAVAAAEERLAAGAANRGVAR